MVLKFFGKRLLAESKLVGLRGFDWLVRNNVPAGCAWWGGKMYPGTSFCTLVHAGSCESLCRGECVNVYNK